MAGKDKKSGGVTPVFDTLSIQEKANKAPKSGVMQPSEDAVERAKNWVDENEL